MKISKTLKKLIAVLCSFAMVVASITVNNVTAKADVANIEITAEVVNGLIEAKWTNPEGTVRTKCYVNQEDDQHYAKASNGWVWSINGPAEVRTSLDTVCGTNGGLDVTAGGTFTIIIVAYSDEDCTVEIGRGVSNEVTVEANTNTDLSVKCDRYEQDGKITVISWQKIGGAAKYEIYAGDTLIKTENSSSAYYTIFDSPEGDGTYICTVKAYNAAGEEIQTTNGTIELNYYKEITSDEPEERPADNYIDKVDTTAWEELPVKNDEAGIVTKAYSINKVAYDALDKGVWGGIYAPHSTADYHNERDKCVLGDAAALITKRQNSTVVSVWINGVRHANNTEMFNYQGDCCEIALDAFSEGENVVSIVYKDGTVSTFAVKVEELKPEIGFLNDRYTQANQGITGTSDSVNSVFLAWNKNDELSKAEAITGKEVAKLELTMNGGNAYNLVGEVLKDVTDIADKYAEVVLPGGTHTYTLTAYDAAGEVIVSETITQENVVNTTQGYIVVEGTIVTPVAAGDIYTFGNAVYGYYDAVTKKAYKAGSEYTVNSNVEFEAINTLSVSVTRGASLRLSYGDNESVGLRFVSQAESDCEVALADQDTIRTGTLITPYSNYVETGELDINSEYKKLTIPNSGWIEGNVGSYGAAVVNIVKSNYIRDFVARAYITVVYADGTETTVYSNINADDHARSATTIAQRILADTENYDKLGDDAKSLVNEVANAQ